MDFGKKVVLNLMDFGKSTWANPKKRPAHVNIRQPFKREYKKKTVNCFIKFVSLLFQIGQSVVLSWATHSVKLGNPIYRVGQLEVPSWATRKIM